jgi:GNAT superfamily N-acetyltransferase
VVRMLACVDYHRQLARVAEYDNGNDREIVGLASFGATDDGNVEVAIVVQDDWQRQRLGTEHAGRLLQAAEARGFHRFIANVSLGQRRDTKAIEESWRRRVDEDERRHFRTRVCPPPNEIGGSILCSRSQNPVSHSLRPWNISRHFRLIRLWVCDMRVLAVCGSLQTKSGNLALLNAAAASMPPGVALVLLTAFETCRTSIPILRRAGCPRA